ncbi:DoxX family membrane protein [Saccharothrix sp. ST-888]|uniref:DoxX family membrane protein n=1 Tax=Saccharothrix sp. ST-888 TaxID=1427391 RepID=UPI000695F997|nr:DoxX family membrane protein [Saccharothrix sp. ST-888]
MDTRTPRRPGQGSSAGIDDDGPGLNTVKVPSDPARLSSTQASFRVRLSTPATSLIESPAGAAFGDPYRMQSLGGRPMVTPQVVVDGAAFAALAGVGMVGSAVAAGSVGTPVRRKGRVTAVTWTGQAAPGDVAATQLLEAVRLNTVPAPAAAPGGSGPLGMEDTQRLEPYPQSGAYGQPDPYGRPEPYGQAVPKQSGSPEGGGRGRPGGGSYGGSSVAPGMRMRPPWTPGGELPEAGYPPSGETRHAWYPGRKVDLGLVLLPLRVLLGSLSVYAGFSKLCDPVYFDGGQRGSMMRWLGSLHPWKVAQPLLDFAMAHPVGAGLGVAFTEVVVGVLSILGLWQRLAAAAAMALSAALLFTVSWRAVPVYDAPDLIFLAAWSPLLIAGAPFGSLDGRIALEAWRRYGSDAPAALRRRILRRGTVVTTLVVGTTLLIGSTLGAAVRTGGRPGPAPVKPPTDYGSPVWPATGPSPVPVPPVAPVPLPSAAASAPQSPSSTPSPSASSPSATSSSAGKGTKSHSTKTERSPSGSGGEGSGAGGAGGRSGGGTATGSGSGPSGSTPKSGSTGGGLLGGVLGSGPMTDLPALGMSGSRYGAGSGRPGGTTV